MSSERSSLNIQQTHIFSGIWKPSPFLTAPCPLPRKNMVDRFPVTLIPTDSVAQSLAFVISLSVVTVGALWGVKPQPLLALGRKYLLSRKEICSLEIFAAWKNLWNSDLRVGLYMDLIFFPRFVSLAGKLSGYRLGRLSLPYL